MFCDKIQIFIKAGDGGDGCTSFYTEKYVANGGPDGGDGGNGGAIILEADPDKSSLLDFQFAKHFKAENGFRGTGKYCHGKSGKDLIIKVPCGTVIRDIETGGIIADMFVAGTKLTVLQGGRGGKGNARFKSSRRQAPHFAQCGEKTIMREISFELMIIADVGLVGYPNVGKSTLLSVMSSARPKIANYHFTTLSPNLGVVKYHNTTFVVADIPGLIEGAGDGAGLGHEFLRHISRTRLIVHTVDISGSEGRNPIKDFKTINKELANYNKRLSQLPQIVCLNKADILADDRAVQDFENAVKKPVILVSAATKKGVDDLIKAIAEELVKLPPTTQLEYEPFVYSTPDSSEFVISRDDDGAYEVSGGLVDELARNVSLDDYDSFNYMQKRLKDSGVIKALRKAGIKDGDLVRITDIEFDFVE